MIVFVGALRNPINCSSYARVEELLGGTLRSLCSQTHSDYRVVVVCNRVPSFHDPVIASKVDFVEVDFPPPSMKRSAETETDDLRRDRSTKYIVGFLAAQKYRPDYVMIFDADDFVSPEIAEFVNGSEEGKNGWYLDSGYILDQQEDRRMWSVKNFHQICGTSLIIRNDLLTQPSREGVVEIDTYGEKKAEILVAGTNFLDRLTVASTQEEILESMDRVFMNFVVGAHRWAADYYGLSPLPFPGAVWNWNTGENWGGVRELTPFWREFVTDDDAGECTWCR